jgi:hypothetical protein
MTAFCLLAASVASAQEPDEPEEENLGPIYVRRFSAGVKFDCLQPTNQEVSAT